MNKKLIDELTNIRDGLDEIIKNLVDDHPAEEESAKEAPSKKSESKVIPMKRPPAISEAPVASRKEREAAETLPDPKGDFTREDLDGLSYNNLKKFAKELGLSATGARDELIDKIMESKSAGKKSSPKKTKATESPAKSASKSPRKLGKVAEPEPEEDEEEEEDPVVAKVNEAVADMEDEEIMDFLADVGVKAKGKRQALIAAVVKAVHDGKIELDEDEDSEDSEADETEEVDEAEAFDINDPANEDMTEERRTALAAFEAETRASFESGEITREELIEWLNEYHDTKDKMKKTSDEDILNNYIYYCSLFITDEGEMPEEEGAYTVNGIPFCCGHPLEYNEDSGSYHCSFCEAEYEE